MIFFGFPKDEIRIFARFFSDFCLTKNRKDLDMKGYPGMPLKPGSAVARAMAERRRVVMRGDKSMFGTPYIAAACPIFDESGAVIGCAVTSESVELQDTIQQMAADLNDNVSVLASSIEEISAQAQEIANTCCNLSESVLLSQRKIKNTNQVIEIIKNIAGRINLLGINAAIEAARIGDAGRGFGVVASEMRKLSTNSSDSIKMIDEVITAIQFDSDRNYVQIMQVKDVVAQIASAIMLVAGAVQNSSDMVHGLHKLAENMSCDE